MGCSGGLASGSGRTGPIENGPRLHATHPQSCSGWLAQIGAGASNQLHERAIVAGRAGRRTSGHEMETGDEHGLIVVVSNGRTAGEEKEDGCSPVCAAGNVERMADELENESEGEKDGLILMVGLADKKMQDDRGAAGRGVLTMGGNAG